MWIIVTVSKKKVVTKLRNKQKKLKTEYMLVVLKMKNYDSWEKQEKQSRNCECIENKMWKMKAYWWYWMWIVVKVSEKKKQGRSCGCNIKMSKLIAHWCYWMRIIVIVSKRSSDKIVNIMIKIFQSVLKFEIYLTITPLISSKRANVR